MPEILVLAGIANDPLMSVSGGVDVSFTLLSSTGVAASVPVPAIGQTIPVLGLSVFVTCPGVMFGEHFLLCQSGYWSDRSLKFEPPTTSK